MEPQSYQLIFRSGPTPGQTYDLQKSEISIGRESTNDIVINDAEVSRKHARLLLQPGGYMLEDLGSTNGTFVNGQRLMGPLTLQPEDKIVFGDSVSALYQRAVFDPDSTVIDAGQPPSPVSDYPAQEPSRPGQEAGEPRQAPPPVYEEDRRARYQEPLPAGPVVYEEDAPPPRRRSAGQNWLLAGCGCLVLLCIACGGFVFLLDQMNMLCDPLLRTFTNLILSIVNPLLGMDYYCPPVFP
jgi:predicted component of type VI protein secretion system